MRVPACEQRCHPHSMANAMFLLDTAEVALVEYEPDSTYFCSVQPPPAVTPPSHRRAPPQPRWSVTAEFGRALAQVDSLSGRQQCLLRRTPDPELGSCYIPRSAPPHAWFSADALMMLDTRCLSATRRCSSLLVPLGFFQSTSIVHDGSRAPCYVWGAARRDGGAGWWWW